MVADHVAEKSVAGDLVDDQSIASRSVTEDDGLRIRVVSRVRIRSRSAIRDRIRDDMTSRSVVRDVAAGGLKRGEVVPPLEQPRRGVHRVDVERARHVPRVAALERARSPRRSRCGSGRSSTARRTARGNRGGTSSRRQHADVSGSRALSARTTASAVDRALERERWRPGRAHARRRRSGPRRRRRPRGRRARAARLRAGPGSRCPSPAAASRRSRCRRRRG